jgi:hypothetical protein
VFPCRLSDLCVSLVAFFGQAHTLLAERNAQELAKMLHETAEADIKFETLLSTVPATAHAMLVNGEEIPG